MEDIIGENETEGLNSLRRDISMRVHILARLMRSAFDRQISELGMTRSQWSVIASVARRPGATQRQIAEILEMSEASAGRLIDRLVADGMLERRARDDDRRARAVFLTPNADPLLKKISELAKAPEERMFRGLSDAEIEQLSELLGRIYANIAPGQ